MNKTVYISKQVLTMNLAAKRKGKNMTAASSWLLPLRVARQFRLLSSNATPGLHEEKVKHFQRSETKLSCSKGTFLFRGHIWNQVPRLDTLRTGIGTEKVEVWVQFWFSLSSFYHFCWLILVHGLFWKRVFCVPHQERDTNSFFSASPTFNPSKSSELQSEGNSMSFHEKKIVL